jgi:hypothetical protein
MRHGFCELKSIHFTIVKFPLMAPVDIVVFCEYDLVTAKRLLVISENDA